MSARNVFFCVRYVSILDKKESRKPDINMITIHSTAEISFQATMKKKLDIPLMNRKLVFEQKLNSYYQMAAI